MQPSIKLPDLITTSSFLFAPGDKELSQSQSQPLSQVNMFSESSHLGTAETGKRFFETPPKQRWVARAHLLSSLADLKQNKSSSVFKSQQLEQEKHTEERFSGRSVAAFLIRPEESRKELSKRSNQYEEGADIPGK